MAQRAKELEQQLSRLKQDLAAEGQDLDELVVCTRLMTPAAASGFASSCALPTLPNTASLAMSMQLGLVHPPNNRQPDTQQHAG